MPATPSEGSRGTVVIGSLPMPMHWLQAPVDWAVDGGLRITAAEHTDLFADPRGAPARRTAPCLLGSAAGDWALSARVSVDFKAVFDAGVLVVYQHEESWAKLCLEYSPTQRPTVVTVVNRGRSDDANAFSVDRPTIWLRVACIAPAWAFHASTDGRRWELVRYFALDPAGEGDQPQVGFSAQSPTGRGCAATFNDIRWSSTPPADIRSGA
jgi:regulation of enolase protein 1 (concanavalin A-like superfamily)